mmetsp:Transcript_27674/g.24503  ORF Transcript_27674/g.24503 Transcript_27674/m.24503 type:complete len:137 (-) Transcript_27674:83-493(-)
MIANVAGNDDFMPQVKPDCGELLTFRAWAASGWVRPMFYFSIITVFVLCILGMIVMGYNDDGVYVFFGIVAILCVCVGSILYHRIFFEMIMGCLQIPRLIIAVEKLESAMRQDLETKSSMGVQVIDDGENSFPTQM